MTALRLTLLVCALGWSARAQYGQPGQYPGQGPGRLPGQGPGQNPPNGRGGSQGRQPAQSRNRNNAPVLTTTSGMLRVVAGGQFVLQADDHRIMTYRIGDKVEFLKDGKASTLENFAGGDHLNVDSTEDDQGYLTAVSVRFQKAGTPDERAAAAETWDLPRLKAMAASGTKSASGSVQRDPGDDRPVLRRKNDAPAADQADAGTTAQNSAPPNQAASNAPAAADAQAEPVDARPTTMMRPADPPPDPDDSGPPRLRRGPPASQRSSARASTSAGESSGGPVILTKPRDPEPPEIALDPGVTASPAATRPEGSIIPIQEDPVIVQARDVAAQFYGSLPNFFCKQMTTRYQSENPKAGWQAIDVVTADVAYENGRESYRNIMVGNKPVKTSMDDIEGSRSTGEFATLLDSLFAPETGTTFRRSGQETLNGRSTVVFKFEVTRERSRWRIESPAQLYYTAYRGTIWIDKQSARVLRIEQQSRNMPLLFPFDTIETAADYDFVRLSTPEQFLLPVNAEVLSCMRGTSACIRNRIEFRNYRKFGVESDITFEPQ